MRRQDINTINGLKYICIFQTKCTISLQQLPVHIEPGVPLTFSVHIIVLRSGLLE